ncbi:hypothetical protein, partial [uncultured Alistipes sp.]|uniref:hypothetical protein n=1 Tax=uncultured Alistipes sp. TaxID=538949 RepID=UPI00266BEE73
FVLDTPPLGNAQNKFGIALGFSYFGFAEDTSPRQCSNKFGIALGFSYFGFAEDTSPRQCSNKFGIALGFSYLCRHFARALCARSGGCITLSTF